MTEPTRRLLDEGVNRCHPPSIGATHQSQSFDWNEINPLYGEPWAESVKKAAAARSAAAKDRGIQEKR